MNLGRETKSAVSSRHHNSGSERSRKLSTLKSSVKMNNGNPNKMSRQTSKDSNRSKCNSITTIMKRQNFGKKHASFDQANHRHRQEKTKNYGDIEQRKSLFKSSLSSIASIEKYDESKNHVKEHCNEHNQRIWNKRSYSLDGNEDNLPSTILRKNGRRQSSALPNEVYPFSSTINKIKQNKGVAKSISAATNSLCIQQINENTDKHSPSTRNKNTGHPSIIR